MKTISKFLDQSNRPVYSGGLNATVIEALEIMAQHNIGALLVLNGQILEGIFSERGCARKAALKEKSSNDAKVSEVMTCQSVRNHVDWAASNKKSKSAQNFVQPVFC
jgi:CBS domain-containing protein